METKKISTYIEGLDDVLGGGFPVGHVVLLSGLPGTMKSTLSYAILHGNARERGAKCLYVSLEQTRKSLEAQMAAMRFDVEAVRGDLHILDGGTRRSSRTGSWNSRCTRSRTSRSNGESGCRRCAARTTRPDSRPSSSRTAGSKSRP